MRTEYKDYALLHFIVVIWGFTAILGRLIEIPSVEIVFFRTLVAALGLYVLLWLRKRSFKLGVSDTLKILGTGFLIAAHWILFFAAARVSTVSVCLAGMATCSLWTSILEPLATKRKVRPFEILLSLLAIAGIVVIFRVEFDHKLGLIMAIVSAAIAAVFTVINAKFTMRHNPYMITFYEMVGACIGTALFFPFYTTYFTDGVLMLNPTSMDWFYLAILALACTVYAYSVSVELMKRLSAFVVNLTVNLEPVYGIILALLIFGDEEEMSGGFYMGTALILVSVLLYPVINRYFKRKALETDVLR
ncbi:MAG: DMT family transporter [bacterium]|nr:DMT family transporter [bacterium]